MRMSVFVCELFHGLLLDTIHLLFVDSAGLLQNMLDLKEKMDGIEKESVDRKSTRLNSSHEWISYAVFCLKKKKVDGLIGGSFDPVHLGHLVVADSVDDELVKVKTCQFLAGLEQPLTGVDNLATRPERERF